MVTPDVPIIVAASMLTRYDFPILPMTKLGAPQEVEGKNGLKLFKAVGGLQIIRLVLETKSSDAYKALWSHCDTTGMWLGTLDYHDSLDGLLRIFEVTGFGDAMASTSFTPSSSSRALISLDEVVHLYQERRLKCGLQVKEIASRAVFVDPDVTLIEAMGTMRAKRVRRLFLSGGQGRFFSDRNVLAFLFSPKALALAKDSPDDWTGAKVSEVQWMRARSVPPGATAGEVGAAIETGRDVFWLSEEASLISKWDLVMKPWKAGQLIEASER